MLYPAEALNVAASNALLKTLEEPPSGVVFLLVSARIDRLLPTIISRCRQWPMAVPAPDAAAAWLAAQGIDQAPALLAEAGGAPLAALALASDENRPLRDYTLGQLAAGAACDPFACGETLQKLPVPLVLGWLQRWLYDLLAQRMAGAPRYFPMHAARALRGSGRCERVRALHEGRDAAADGREPPAQRAARIRGIVSRLPGNVRVTRHCFSWVAKR